MIHIHAKCKMFEVFEVIAEPLSYQRLEMWLAHFKRYRDGMDDQLVVNTVIINPTLFGV